MSKNRILIICIFLIHINKISFAQIEFEQGYFIDSNNQRVECFIKNSDWKNNPTEFNYKLFSDDVIKTAKVAEIKEFGVGAMSRYVGADLKIDRSSDVTSQLTYDRNPVWNNERLFLKVLIDGKASLLYYSDGNLIRFFYQIGDTIQQLVYKKYHTDNNTSKTNQAFRQQLFMNVKCGNGIIEDFNHIDYNKGDLKKYFIDFNKCSGIEFVDYTILRERDFFNLKITPGINSGTMAIKDDYTRNHAKSGTFQSIGDIRIGLEAEFVLPFNNDKWSLIIEPNYQSYNSTFIGTTETYKVRYNSFEIPVGLRYYMFFNKDSRLFINALMGKSFPINSFIDMRIVNEPFGVSPSANISVGIGYNFKRIGCELRYYKNRDMLNEYIYWGASYTRISLILGIKIF
ncbi:MAG: outer membrane beta-barrel protein [Cyclobacteriaceae bacterium]|nr:outer membrane beta-barrel protein [Cyclobacteriaceae bacterium]